MSSLFEIREKINTFFRSGRKLKNEISTYDTYLKNYTLLELLAKNRFDWKNLPNGIESRYIENALFNTGKAMFTYLDNEKFKGFICLPCYGNSEVNLYGEHTEYNLVGRGIEFNNIKKDDGVIIRDSIISYPSIQYVEYYARKLTEIESNISTNLRQQKYPFIITTTENMRLTSKLIMDKIEKGEENIFIDKEMSDSLGKNCGINILQTGVPYLIDKFQEHKNYLEKEILSFLGLNNTTEKKERMLVDEVNVNNSHILLTLESFYKLRLKACNDINEKYKDILEKPIEVVKVIDDIDTNIFSLDDIKGDEGSEQI